MTIINIDFTKIDKNRLKKGTSKKGENYAYGELVLIPYKDGPRERNGITSDGFVKQGTSKEDRESGVEMPIIGEFREVGKKSQAPARPAARAAANPDFDGGDEDSVPF